MRVVKNEAERKIDITITLSKKVKYAAIIYANERNPKISLSQLIENLLKKEMGIEDSHK